ncbi:hypothetical protein D3C71_1192590 [compost metagenome]
MRTPAVLRDFFEQAVASALLAFEVKGKEARRIVTAKLPSPVAVEGRTAGSGLQARVKDSRSPWPFGQAVDGKTAVVRASPSSLAPEGSTKTSVAGALERFSHLAFFRIAPGIVCAQEYFGILQHQCDLSRESTTRSQASFTRHRRTVAGYVGRMAVGVAQ